MATVKELAYALLEMVNGGMPTDDSKINYRVARLHIRNGLGFYLRRKNFEESNQSESNYTSESNSITKAVEVKSDPESGLQYVDLIGESVDLGGMRSYSLSSTNPLSRWSIKFVPITKNELFVQGYLPNIPDVIQFYKDGNRLYLRGYTSDATLSLTQKNVISDDDDDEIPSDLAQPALEHAYRLAMGIVQIPSDKDNNGVSNN